MNIFSERTVRLQLARCSFDVHIEDIVGSLTIGATLVMIRPQGNMDFGYLSRLFEQKEITYMFSVPTVLSSFFQFLEENSRLSAIESLRVVCTTG